MHLVVVGDEVVNRVRAQRREEEVIDPVVALGIYRSKNTLHMLDAGRIAEFLVLGQQYLARDPARRARVSGEFPDRLGVDQKVEAERGGALNYLYSEPEYRAPGLPGWSVQAGSVRWHREESAASIRGSPFVRTYPRADSTMQHPGMNLGPGAPEPSTRSTAGTTTW